MSKNMAIGAAALNNIEEEFLRQKMVVEESKGQRQQAYGKPIFFQVLVEFSPIVFLNFCFLHLVPLEMPVQNTLEASFGISNYVLFLSPL